MKNRTVLLGSAVALVLAAPVYAQSAITGIEGLDTRIDDIQTDVVDDIERSQDTGRYGVTQFAPGWVGSVSLGFSASTGNTDTTDLSLGGRFRYGAGDWNHTLGFAAEFAEVAGVSTEEELFATYDANRYFNDSFYVFGLASVRYDAFATNELDAFIGVGPGYRLINTDTTAFRIQAGPGVRYSEDQVGAEETELAAIVSSRFYHAFTNEFFLTNDTDVLLSDASTLATNELGLNYRMTDAITTRMSYRTEYDSEPLPGFVDTDNTLGFSLIFGF